MPCMAFGLKWGKDSLFDVLAQGAGKLDHDPRLYEVETATVMGIPFDSRWYKLEVEVRAQHIASRLARISIENKLIEEAHRGR